MTNAETITNLANTALDLHTRARAQITPGGDTIGDGMPHAGGFGPRAPDNGAMMSLSDSLTAASYNLLAWLWDTGVKPREYIPGVWTRRNVDTFDREPLGDDSTGLGMANVHQKIVENAPWIAGLPGVEIPVVELERIINIGLKVFPGEDTTWITIRKASAKYNRSERTVLDWVKSGIIEHVGEGENILVKDEEVSSYVETIKRLRIENINKVNGRNR